MVNPTGYTALDLIGFTDQGTYSSSDNYVKNDLVHYSGNIWRCLIDDTSGIAPVEGVNWTLFIGEPTNLVERIIAPVETNPATNSYAVGRQFIYNDNLYEVIVAITAGDALVAYEDDPTNANIKLADAVETQLLDLKGNLSNRNLLDNPWFTVNQRGFSTQSSLVGYTVDRWKQFSAYGTVTLDSDGCIVLDNSSGTSNLTFIQFLPSDLISALDGKTVTFSILFEDGTLLTNTASDLDFTQNIFYANISIGSSSASLRSLGNGNAYIQFVITSGDTLSPIKAVKLEVGEISTLAMDTVPNYAEELLRCQRYFYRIGGSSTPAYTPIGSGFIKNANRAYIYTKLPNTMRAAPTLTQNGKIYVQTVSLGIASSTCNVESASARGLETVLLYLSPDTSNQFSAEIGKGATAQFNMSGSGTADSYIDFSADL